MEAVRIVTGTAVPLDRSDVDTDQIIPSRLAQAGRAHRLREGPVLGVARRPGLRAQPGAVRRRHHPGRRPQLRHRLVPRARRVGHPAVRLPGRDLAPVRRHLPQQLRPRTASCPVVVSRRGRRAAAAGRRGRSRRSRSRSTSSGARSRRRRSASSVELPARRLGPAPVPRGPRRHRPHAPPRRRDRRLRGQAPGLAPHHRRHRPEGPAPLRTLSLSRVRLEVRDKVRGRAGLRARGDGRRPAELCRSAAPGWR